LIIYSLSTSLFLSDYCMVQHYRLQQHPAIRPVEAHVIIQ